MAKLAELEMVTYRNSDIEDASYYFIRRLGQRSQAYGPITSSAYFSEVRTIIDEKKPKPFKLSTPGFDLYFSGVIPPMPRMENGQLIFAATELGFAILPNDRTMETISGSARKSHLQQIADEVMAEMHKKYLLDVQREPSLVSFPKELYGKVDVRNAALID